jgi:hypothetical protein
VTVPGFGVQDLVESPDRVFVDKGHVFALIPQYIINVRSNGREPLTSFDAFFDASPAVFATDGIERHRTPTGDEHRNPLPMRWFVEVNDSTKKRAWVTLYEHDAQGRQINGALSDLVTAVEAGRPVRLVGQNFNGQVDTAIFPTGRLITNFGHVFASVALFIQSFRFAPGDNPVFNPYNYDSYIFGRPVTGVSVFGTDGFERFRAGNSAPEQRIPRSLSWVARV